MDYGLQRLYPSLVCVRAVKVTASVQSAVKPTPISYSLIRGRSLGLTAHIPGILERYEGSAQSLLVKSDPVLLSFSSPFEGSLHLQVCSSSTCASCLGFHRNNGSPYVVFLR